MNYIGENDAYVDAFKENCIEHRIMEFNVDKKDFFLVNKIIWDSIKCSFYDVEIGGGVFSIPAGHFIMIGDEYGDIDWIVIDELFSRSLSVACFDMDFRNWSVSDVRVSDVYSGEIFWPNTKHIIPIQSNGVTILLSEKDQHHKTQDQQIEIFTQL